MIPRYTPPEMGQIWTDQRRYETWLSVECAAADAMAQHGVIPAEAARDIRRRAKVEASRIDEIAQNQLGLTVPAAGQIASFGSPTESVLTELRGPVALELSAGARPRRGIEIQ